MAEPLFAGWDLLRQDQLLLVMLLELAQQQRGRRGADRGGNGPWCGRRAGWNRWAPVTPRSTHCSPSPSIAAPVLILGPCTSPRAHSTCPPSVLPLNNTLIPPHPHTPHHHQRLHFALVLCIGY